MESKILKAEKKSRKKRGKSEAETGSLLRVCSSSSERKKKRITEPQTEPGVLPEKEEEEEAITDSEAEKKKKKKKKKKKESTTDSIAAKKKNRKSGETEAESGSLLRRCSSSTERKKKKKRTTEPEPESEQPNIVPEEKEEEATTEYEAKKKKKKKWNMYRYGSLKTLITTVTSTTTVTTIITPPEDPNNHVHLYFCVATGPNGFTWFKIDPSNTTVESPKHHKNDNSNYHCSPISQMPSMPRGFLVIPHSSPEQKKKLVYAIGGSVYLGGRSSKALVCDFASSSSPIWEELPPMPSELQICMGVASPLDGNLYAFGYMRPEHPRHPYTHMGLVFDPSSTSWNQCPHPFGGTFYPQSVNDYAVIDTEDQTQLYVFTSTTQCRTFNISTARWEHSLCGIVPKDCFPDGSVGSSSVGVGHLIFKFHNRKLYAFDSSSPERSPFEPVLGLGEFQTEFTVCRADASIVYLGKGKLCIVWDAKPDPAENAPEQTLYINCLMFWVGMCTRTNRLRAVIDRCERFSAHGGKLYSVVAL